MLPSVAICVATSGRRDILTQCLATSLAQKEPVEELLICPAYAADCDAEAVRAIFPQVRIVEAVPGLPSQRNALLKAAQSDIVVFLDDDFIIDDDFVLEVRRLFAEHPDIVVATGAVVADGILGPGLGVDEGSERLARAPRAVRGLEDVHNAYGCNMVISMTPVRAASLAFDTALPLYAWLEDVDFCRRLAPFGRIVKASQLRGVHLGTKTGRGRGRRLGYSQIANPLYLRSKGTLSLGRALAQMARNLAANGVKSVRPEPWVDRKGRLAGNLMGLRDMATGRLHPQRILEFD